jgi:spectinomycin phosphotransferase
VRELPNGIETDAVVEALVAGWGFVADAIDYAAVGAGSYHWIAADAAGARRFVTVDDLDQKRWLGDTRDVAHAALGRAFDTAVALRKAGLEFVVAPIPTSSGESLQWVSERHTVAVFPFVDGEGGRWGPYEHGARDAVVSMLADLHRAAPAGPMRTVGLELTGRSVLEAALRDVNETWSGGPLSEPARMAFSRRSTDVPEFLALADRLAAGAGQRGAATVVTHGEPHAGNVLRTEEGHVLVDWDTVALGSRERDLWWLADEPGDLAAYTALTGHEVNPEAVAFFRLAWDLNDVAQYLGVLRLPHVENEDTRDAYAGVTRCMPNRDEWLID